MTILLGDIVMADLVRESQNKYSILSQFDKPAAGVGAPCFHSNIHFHPLDKCVKFLFFCKKTFLIFEYLFFYVRPVDLIVSASFEPMHVTLPAESLSRIIGCVNNISMSDPSASAVAVSSVQSRLSAISHRTSVQLLNALDRRMIIDLNLKLAGPKIELPVNARLADGTSCKLYLDFGEIKYYYWFCYSSCLFF
jgi:hypothetical protein